MLIVQRGPLFSEPLIQNREGCVCFKVVLGVAFHISTFNNRHRLGTYETDCFCAACANNEHVGVRSWLKALFSSSTFLFLERAMWQFSFLTCVFLRQLSLSVFNLSLARVCSSACPNVPIWLSCEMIYNCTQMVCWFQGAAKLLKAAS